MPPPYPEKTSLEVAISVSEDGHQLMLETPQTYRVALLYVAFGITFLGYGFYELLQSDPVSVVPDFVQPSGRGRDQAAWIFGLVSLGIGLSDIYRSARVDTLLNLADQTATVRNSLFGHQARTETVALSSITDLHLVGTRRYWAPCARIVANHSGGALPLTGSIDTTTADHTQRAVQSFLGPLPNHEAG